MKSKGTKGMEELGIRTPAKELNYLSAPRASPRSWVLELLLAISKSKPVWAVSKPILHATIHSAAFFEIYKSS